MPQPFSFFVLEDALSFIVFFLPVTCSVGLSLLVAATGPFALFFFCGGNRFIATLSCIQFCLGALIDPSSIPLLLGVVGVLIARTCSCFNVWDDDAQLGIVAWRIGWLLTLSFGGLHMVQGSSWTIAELLPSIDRDDTLDKDMVRRSVAVIVMDMGVSVLGVAIEYWMVTFRDSTILLPLHGERQLLFTLACILVVMVCASLVIHSYCLHVVGAIWDWWKLLHIAILLPVSAGVNTYLLLKALPWYFRRRYSRWSWSSFVYEALVHEVDGIELGMGPIPASQEPSQYSDALVISASASAHPEVRPLGHVVLEAGGLIRTQRGQLETLFQLIQSKSQDVHIEEISGGLRPWARVRVSFDEEAKVRRIVKEIARERNQRVNIKRVEVVYQSPRD